MIISHKLKVIYIKLRKVAGTSFEIALSKYCGPDDIIAPFGLFHFLGNRGNETIRQLLGFHGPQNYHEFKKPGSTIDHISAQEIKSSVSLDIWNNYLKIATIRCPYDMLISGYCGSVSNKEKISAEAFEKRIVENPNRMAVKHLRDLHIEGEMATDFLIRYEYLDEDIGELERRINCPGLLKIFSGIRANSDSRPEKGTSSHEMYSKCPHAKLTLDKLFLEYSNQYEFFSKYWPGYKAELEKAMINNQNLNESGFS